MLTELEALVSDDTSSLIDDEGLARRWGKRCRIAGSRRSTASRSG